MSERTPADAAPTSMMTAPRIYPQSEVFSHIGKPPQLASTVAQCLALQRIHFFVQLSTCGYKSFDIIISDTAGQGDVMWPLTPPIIWVANNNTNGEYLEWLYI